MSADWKETCPGNTRSLSPKKNGCLWTPMDGDGDIWMSMMPMCRLRFQSDSTQIRVRFHSDLTQIASGDPGRYPNPASGWSKIDQCPFRNRGQLRGSFHVW